MTQLLAEGSDHGGLALCCLLRLLSLVPDLYLSSVEAPDPLAVDGSGSGGGLLHHGFGRADLRNNRNQAILYRNQAILYHSFTEKCTCLHYRGQSQRFELFRSAPRDKRNVGLYSDRPLA